MAKMTRVILREDVRSSTNFFNVAGEIDVSTATNLRKNLFRALEGAPSQLLIRLKHIPYMDSAGVAVMLELIKTARLRGIEIVLLEPSPAARRALNMVDILALVKMYDSIDECAMCTSLGANVIRTQLFTREELKAAGMAVSEAKPNQPQGQA